MATSTYLTTYQSPSSASSHSHSATLGSTFTGKVVVVTAVESASDVSGVTFDGTSMTLDQSQSNGSLLKIRTFYLDLASKASGTYSVVATGTGSVGLIFSVVALTDVATGASEAFGTSTAAPGTATLTATSNAALIAAACNSSGSVTQTFTGDVTERDDRVITAAFGAAVADASNVSAGTRTATSTPSTGTNFLLLVSYAHSGGGGGGGGGGSTPRRRTMLRAPANTQRGFKPESRMLFGATRLDTGPTAPSAGGYRLRRAPRGGQ